MYYKKYFFPLWIRQQHKFKKEIERIFLRNINNIIKDIYGFMNKSKGFITNKLLIEFLVSATEQ